MDRSVLLMWIRTFLEKANDEELEYIMYFIRGYLRIDKRNYFVDNVDKNG